MFVVQSKGFRIGPHWYTEATFKTREEAESWLRGLERLDMQEDLRIEDLRIIEDDE